MLTEPVSTTLNLQLEGNLACAHGPQNYKRRFDMGSSVLNFKELKWVGA
jgi:hypothetical protein